MNNFWQQLKINNPECITALAPMADVTDNPFRRILSEIGAPAVYWNEFVAADGLSHSEARPKLERMLAYEEDQRPIVAQIFSGSPENCANATKICIEHGFDAVDINMGCPVKNITKQTSGSELTKVEHRELVKNMLQACREASEQSGKNTPISIKTRLGWNEIDMTWIEFLFTLDLPVLTLHLRTRKEMSKVPAHWELMTEIREMRDRLSPNTLLIGNGDVESVEQGQKLCKEHGIDGVMVGRGLFTNPWLFGEIEEPVTRSVAERLELAIRHTQYYLDEYTVDGVLGKNFNLMKKFYKVYINGFPGAKELRVEMMSATSIDDVKQICQNFLEKGVE